MLQKVVLLTSDQPAALALARAARALAHTIVASGISLTGIIVETTPRPKGWKQTVHDFLGEDLFLRLASLRWSSDARQLGLAEHRLQRRADRILGDLLGEETRSFPDVRTLYTDSVNSDAGFEFLQNERPDLTVAFATGILKKRTFDAARLGTVNAHTSLLPDYRGFWPEFWQIYDRAYAKTGITIHFIDEGLDTGDIVFREHVPATDDTDPFLLRTFNTLEILRTYPRVIKNILSGTFSRKPQATSSTPVYRFKDVTVEKKRELFRRLRVV
jgi:folate-dependent phosphoribosylglycinamide formyltransferase PurN